MASPKKSQPLPKPSEFHGLSAGYLRLLWYSVVVRDEPGQVLVTLPRTDWFQAAKQSLLYSLGWAALVGLGWLIDRRPLELRPVLSLGGLVCLWPLYVPLGYWLLLRRRMPWIRFDKEQGVVHLRRHPRQAPIENVIAICEVIYSARSDEDSRLERYELQLMIEQQGQREFVLITGSWGTAAAIQLAPIAARLAACLDIMHLRVDVMRGEVIDRSRDADVGVG